MDESFIRDRITQLRLQKGVSEYKMSYDLGHSRSYINNITSGKALPSMGEFLTICDYFQIAPNDFFNETIHNPTQFALIEQELTQLSEDDLAFVLHTIRHLSERNH